MIRHGQCDIIVYGIGGTLKQSLEYLRERFNIVGCSDKNPDKAQDEMVVGIPYYKPEELKEIAYDYIFISSDFDTPIKKYLVEELDIKEDKVLKRDEWYRLPVIKEYGELNPDKTFYLLSKPIRVKNGLLSNVLCFLEQLSEIEDKGYIPVVDMMNYPNQYLEQDNLNRENSWEYYYEPLSQYSLQEVYQSKSVILGYDHNCYTENYTKRYDIEKLAKLYKKYIKVKLEAMDIINAEYDKLLGGKQDVLGVLFRGTDMSSLKLEHHSVQPTVDEMIELIYEHLHKWQCKWVYLCTEDEAAMNRFKEEFGDKLISTGQQRFANTGDQWLAQIENQRDNDKYLRGIEYLTAIELLSRCDYLLAGICSGSVCDLIMNGGEYKDVCMVEKGSY